MSFIDFCFCFVDKCARHHHGCRAGVCHPAEHNRQTALWPGKRHLHVLRALTAAEGVQLCLFRGRIMPHISWTLQPTRRATSLWVILCYSCITDGKQCWHFCLFVCVHIRERVVNTSRPGEMQVTIQNLMPDTKYRFRVMAHNSNGQGESSAALKVATQAEGNTHTVHLCVLSKQHT